LAVPGSPTSFKNRTNIISKLITKKSQLTTIIDPKASISSYAKIGKKVTYENTSTGPDHSKEFSSKVLLSDNVIGTGKGKSKKNAEQMAAKAALLNAKN